MNDPNLSSPNATAMPNPATIYSSPYEEEVNLRELIDIVLSGKWIVIGITLAITLLGIVYALVAQPLYQSGGLVQVEQEKSALGDSGNQLATLIGSAPAEVSAEIAIFKSRMVLAAVVDNLKLYIRVRPNYFPFFGEAIARHHTDGNFPTDLPGWLLQYAWGGEELSVTAFDVPEALYDQPFVLEARDGGFALLNADTQVVLQGAVGERQSIETPFGPLSIFVQKLKARPQTRFYVAHLSPTVILAEIAGQVTAIEQPPSSGMLAVTVLAPNPGFAAVLLDAVQDAYLKQNVERKSAQAEQSLEFLKRQMPELRGHVDAAQAQLNAYQLKKGTIDVQQETQIVLQRAVQLETQRVTLVQERDAALQRFTDQHPVILTLSDQIRGIEREQSTIKKQAEALPETQQEILSLMRDLEVNTQLYTAMLNSAQELQVAKAATVGNVRIIDRALSQRFPIKPNRMLIVLLSGIVGLTLGLGAVFGIRMLLPGVERPEQVERVLGLPTYASIPYSNSQHRLSTDTQRRKKGTHILAAIDGQDTAIEALRGLRTSLHFAMLEAPNNIVMLTGPIAALGKSFVSVNLSAVLALGGKRTLVLDADLRRGHLHRYVDAEQSPGISDYVAGKADHDSIVRSTSVENLFFVPGGTRPPNPSEILMHERFAALLKHYSGKYDYVLIDTPPVLPVTDAAIVGRLAGTTLVVLKSAEHPMRAIEETVNRLTQAGVQVRGAIFNQVGAKIGSYGYGAYGYAYGYSADGYRTSK